MIIKCPKCGFERLKEDISIAPSYECPVCGIIYNKYKERIQQTEIMHESDIIYNTTQESLVADNIDIKENIKEIPNINELNTNTAQQVNKMPINRLINPIIIFSIVIALIISFIGYKFYLKIENNNAEREFSVFVSSISEKMIQLTVRSEIIVDKINTSWREAIFSEYSKRDFNEAILEVRVENLNTIKLISSLSEEISQNIKQTKPPIGKEKDYQRLRELYLLFNKYANMAISPSGSLQSYSQQNSELSYEIKNAFKELEMMK